MFGAIAIRAGLRYYPVVSGRPRRRQADITNPEEASRTAWNLLEGDDFVAKCDSNTSHPSHADASQLPLGCGSGINTAADVNYELLGPLLAQALDDIGCRDSFCAREFGGPWVNMRTGGREGVREDW
jgi:hypothetical protein